jgi:hypothetical protein
MLQTPHSDVSQERDMSNEEDVGIKDEMDPLLVVRRK